METPQIMPTTLLTGVLMYCWESDKRIQGGQVESAGKSRKRVGGESPPHGNG